MNTQKRHILGVATDDVTMEEAIGLAEKMLAGGRSHIICTLNPEIVLRASKDASYTLLLNATDLALPDGIGLVWISRLIGMPLRERVAGVDFMLRMCGLAAQKGNSVFFLGGRNGVAQRTEQTIQQEFPSLRSAGHSEDVEHWRDIPALFKADIIFVALGAPRQEQWMSEVIPHLPAAKILMAVGGSFDMISGAIPRAPAWLRNAGLEWFWRFALEPHKRFMRVCNAVIIFPIKALIYTFMHY